MKSNNHATAAQYATIPADERLIEATLAVAYEQRTANLITLWLDPKVQNDEGLFGVDYGNVAKQIKERLGLE